jgi:hypothetical protein
MSSHWVGAFVMPTCVDEFFGQSYGKKVDFIFLCQATRNVQIIFSIVLNRSAGSALRNMVVSLAETVRAGRECPP